MVRSDLSQGRLEDEAEIAMLERSDKEGEVRREFFPAKFSFSFSFPTLLDNREVTKNLRGMEK